MTSSTETGAHILFETKCAKLKAKTSGTPAYALTDANGKGIEVNESKREVNESKLDVHE